MIRSQPFHIVLACSIILNCIYRGTICVTSQSPNNAFVVFIMEKKKRGGNKTINVIVGYPNVFGFSPVYLN